VLSTALLVLVTARPVTLNLAAATALVVGAAALAVTAPPSR
jgi:hypothetical protein